MNLRDQLLSLVLLGLTLATATGLSLALMMTALPPRAGSAVMLIATPWAGSAAEIAQRAGGVPVTPWATRRIAALVRFEGDIPVEALHRQGIWAVLDGQKVADFCGEG